MLLNPLTTRREWKAIAEESTLSLNEPDSEIAFGHVRIASLLPFLGMVIYHQFVPSFHRLLGLLLRNSRTMRVP